MLICMYVPVVDNITGEPWRAWFPFHAFPHQCGGVPQAVLLFFDSFRGGDVFNLLLGSVQLVGG